MKYIIYNFSTDDYLIDSFLEAASISHKIEKQTKDWFYWKFGNFPYGDVILSCAVENDQIVGCVGFSPQLIKQNGNDIKAFISCETFVHPKFQGKGLFSKLLTLAEEQIVIKKGKVALNFPNTNSLQGFLKKGWTQSNSIIYKIKIIKPIRILLKLNNLTKTFIPQVSNLEKIHNVEVPFIDNEQSGVYPIYTKEYIKWRFLTYPNGYYHIVNDKNCFSVIKLGNRGDISEAQILYLYPLSQSTFSMKKLLKEIKLVVNPDLVSISSTSPSYLYRKTSKHLFFNVPNKGNCCYKIMDTSLYFDFSAMEYDRIIAHTY